MSDAPVFSRTQRELVAIGDRTYTIAPLTYRERQAFRADTTRAGGVWASDEQLNEALRFALVDLAPANLPELLDALTEGAEVEEHLRAGLREGGEAPELTDAQRGALARLAAIRTTGATLPGYAAVLSARQMYIAMLPWCAARHALRAWEGPDLPPFRRAAGVVPEDLLDALPEEDVAAIGARALDLMQPPRSAAKNSEAPSPSLETPAPSPEG
jgi:predicted alpha/beta hydrolase